MALALPESEERETWGEATFRVHDRIFLMMTEDETLASVKATRDEQDIVIASDPKTFSPAPYVGRHGWVRVVLRTVEPDMMAMLINEAWRLTAPKRLVAMFDAPQGQKN
jgi:hypothetical protein